MADFEEQKRQAAEFYATLNDEELKELAAEAWTLTEGGEQALRAELARRGLAVELAAPPDTNAEVEQRQMARFEEQKRQAAEFYATLNEEELKELAAEAWTLTEAGEQALRAELARRGLAVELAAPPDTDTEVAQRHLVTLRTFRDMPEALLAQGALTSAGIESFLMDETTIRMDWFWSNLLGGIKLRVDRTDAPAAAQVLGQEIPEKFTVEGVGDFEQPRCPKCRSLDIAHKDSERIWTCQACGHKWQDS